MMPQQHAEQLATMGYYIFVAAFSIYFIVDRYIQSKFRG